MEVEVYEADGSRLEDRNKQPTRILQLFSNCKEIRGRLLLLWGTGETLVEITDL